MQSICYKAITCILVKLCPRPEAYEDTHIIISYGTGPEPVVSESWPGLLFPESRPLFSTTWGEKAQVFMEGCVG